jgi:hypothetical protein
MFLLGIAIIALIPIAVLFLLPELGKPVDQRRKSILLLSFVAFAWLVAIYLIFLPGDSLGKATTFFIWLPAALTYFAFFKDAPSKSISVTENKEPKN